MVRVLQGLLAAAGLIFLWYLGADRATPFTASARVQAVVTPIVPKVSGQVIEVSAVNGALVDAGAVLARIDPTDFEITEARARAQVEQAAQAMGAGSADVEQAQAGVVRAEADLVNTTAQVARALELERKGLIAVARADDARAALVEAEAAVDSARAALEAAQARLGGSGEQNAGLRVALAQLAQAELDLSRTVLKAPAQGAVSNLTVSEGAYAGAGKPLMQFVDSENLWVEAWFTENNLSRMSLGAPAEVVLDIHPGRVLKGRVESFSGAVTTGTGTGLASAPGDVGWMRAAQRFPVRIVLPGYRTGRADDDVLFQVGGQADVIVYNGDGGVLNVLGRAYIRAVSVLSYAY